MSPRSNLHSRDILKQQEKVGAGVQKPGMLMPKRAVVLQVLPSLLSVSKKASSKHNAVLYKNTETEAWPLMSGWSPEFSSL